MFNQKISQLKHSQGFTLVELMITIAILAILASVVIPSYQGFIQSSRRADAMKAIGIATVLLQNCKDNNASRNYVNCLTIVDGKVDGLASKYYDVTVQVTDIVGAPTTGLAYTLTATPKTGTSQANDDECQSFFFNQTGLNYPPDSTDAVKSTAEKCWKQ